MQAYPRIIFLVLYSISLSSLGEAPTAALIDDRRSGGRGTPLGTEWRLVTDGVMGGVSRGELRVDRYRGRDCLRMTGGVSTANNGGFLQMSLDLGPGGGSVNASAFAGVEMSVAGNGEHYNLHIRTADLTRPWQSYRFTFETDSNWRQIKIPFSELTAHRTDAPFRSERLRRVGLVAIGREFQADLCLADMRFFR